MSLPIPGNGKLKPPPPKKVEEVAPAAPDKSVLMTGRAIAQTFSDHAKETAAQQERIVQAIAAALSKVSAPVVNVPPSVVEMPPPCTWIFDVKRDSKGRLEQVIARPGEPDAVASKRH